MDEKYQIEIEDVIACLEWLRLEGFITLWLNEKGEPMIRINELADDVEAIEDADYGGLV